VTLQDLDGGDLENLPGFNKIRGSCELARRDGFDYIVGPKCYFS
jgi:hypothetical protein